MCVGGRKASISRPPSSKTASSSHLRGGERFISASLTVREDENRGGDGEKNHDEGGVTLARLTLGSGVMDDFLRGAEKVTERHAGVMWGQKRKQKSKGALRDVRRAIETRPEEEKQIKIYLYRMFFGISLRHAFAKRNARRVAASGKEKREFFYLHFEPSRNNNAKKLCCFSRRLVSIPSLSLAEEGAKRRQKQLVPCVLDECVPPSRFTSHRYL